MKTYVLAFALGLFMFFIPNATRALDTGVGFGGLVNIAIPCSCSAGTWIYYTPLWGIAPLPVTGALWFPPGARLYAWFQLGVPGTWNLGSYAPGTGEGCWIVAPDPADPCILLPALGTIEYMGTSKLL